MQIAIRVDREIDHAVTGNLVEHVLEEGQSSFELCLSLAIEVHAHGDLSLERIPLHCCAALRHVLLQLPVLPIKRSGFTIRMHFPSGFCKFRKRQFATWANHLCLLEHCLGAVLESRALYAAQPAESLAILPLRSYAR